MRTITKALSDLSPDEYRACHYLNMRGGGMMMYSLRDNKDSNRSYAVMIWQGDKLIGWALCIAHGDDVYWRTTRYQRARSKFITQFYVRKPYRGKGVGASLMAAVKELDSTPTVIPHDATSARFFASYDVLTSVDRRGLITSAKKSKLRAS